MATIRALTDQKDRLVVTRALGTGCFLSNGASIEDSRWTPVDRTFLWTCPAPFSRCDVGFAVARNVPNDSLQDTVCVVGDGNGGSEERLPGTVSTVAECVARVKAERPHANGADCQCPAGVVLCRVWHDGV